MVLARTDDILSNLALVLIVFSCPVWNLAILYKLLNHCGGDSSNIQVYCIYSNANARISIPSKGTMSPDISL
jgi:hypothetical protein